MRKLLPRIALVGALSLGLVTTQACNATFNTNVDIDATINATTSIDTERVVVEQEVPIDLNVTGVYLVEPAQTPPAAMASTAGHIRVYFDSTSSTELLITAQTHINVRVPREAQPGRHKLICRIHRHDGTPTNQQFEININVTASVTVGGDAGGSTPDAAPDAPTGG